MIRIDIIITCQLGALVQSVLHATKQPLLVLGLRRTRNGDMAGDIGVLPQSVEPLYTSSRGSIGGQIYFVFIKKSIINFSFLSWSTIGIREFEPVIQMQQKGF